MQTDLAMVDVDCGDFEAAEALLRASLATLDREIPDHPKVAQVHETLQQLSARAEER